MGHLEVVEVGGMGSEVVVGGAEVVGGADELVGGVELVVDVGPDEAVAVGHVLALRARAGMASLGHLPMMH